MNVTTRALPATDTQGARIKVTGPLGEAVYPYDYGAADAHQEAAERYTHKHCREVRYTSAGSEFTTIPCPFPNSPTHHVCP